MERTPEADGVTDGAMDGAGLGVGGLLGCALHGHISKVEKRILST